MAGNIINTGTTVDLTGLRNLRVELETLKRQYADVSKSAQGNINQLIDRERELANAIKTGNAASVSAFQLAADAQRAFTSDAIGEQIKLEGQIKRVQEAMAKLNGETRSFVGVIPGFGVAAERFISSIPGLGAVLEKAFPLFGAVAFGEVVVRIGEQIYKLAEQWDPLTRAIKEGQEEAQKFDKSLKEIKASIIALDAKAFTAAFGEAAGKGKEIADYENKRLQDVRQIQLIESAIADAKKDYAKYKSFDIIPDVGSVESTKQTREQLAIYEQIKKLNLELTDAKNKAVENDKKNSGVVREFMKVQEDGIQALLDKQKQAADEEARYVLERRSEIARQQEEGRREIAAASDKINKENAQKRLEDLTHDIQDIVAHHAAVLAADRQFAADQKKLSEEHRQEIQTNGSLAEAGIGIAKAGAQAGKSRADSSIFGATQAQDVAYLEEIKELDRELIQEKIQTQLKLLQLDTVNNPEKVQADIRKLTEIQKQGQITMLNDQTAILNREQQQYKKFFGQLNSDATRAFKDLLVNPKNFVADLNQIWVKMVTDFADKLLLMGLQWVENEALMLIVHATAKEDEVGIDASAAAQKKAIKLSETLSEINADAVASAAGAYASTVDIPIIGPYLAPIAAAAAYTAVLGLGALGSFETGTDYVPKTGLYQLHQGEAVIPKNQNGGGMSVTQHINGANHSPEQIASMSLSGIQSFARRSNWVPG